MLEELLVWRHPRPCGAHGRCIGSRTDLGVDRRRAKRLAHRIRALARREGLPRCIHSSTLTRSRAVGCWLRRWGWRHQIVPDLVELDFGAWDGRDWAAIAQAEIDAWCADFAHHRPGGGESLLSLFERASAWQPPARVALVVGHAGWMQARAWGARPPPTQAADWPAPPAYASLMRIRA